MILQNAREDRKKRVTEILQQVFPPISWVFGGARLGSSHSDSWFRDHRACHGDVFDRYFYLTIPEGDLSHEELERIVALAGDREDLVNSLRSLGKRGLLEVTIDRLESYKETINLDHAVSFLTALFDIGDELPVGEVGLFRIPPSMHAARIVHWYLKREPNIQRRQEILSKCVSETAGLYLPAFVVALERDKSKEGNENERLADDVAIKQLQDLCVSKIRQAATNGTLAKNPRMGELISFWRAWSSPAESKEWVRKLVEGREGLFSFLNACMRKTTSHGIGRYAGHVSWKIDLQATEMFIEPELIQSRLGGAEWKDLKGNEREVIAAFEEA